MIVAFDGACLADGPITGVGRAFLDGLAAYARAFVPRTAVYLLIPGPQWDPHIQGVQAVPAPRGALARQWQLPRLLRQLRASVLHSPVAAVPLRAPCPTLATVHDLPWLCPEAGEPTPLWRRFATRASLRAASAVIAPSDYTLAAARRIAPGGARLLCVPHGIELPPSVPSSEPRHGPILVLGDDRPRKNRATVRAAHALARQQQPDLPELCFAGPPDHYVDEAEKVRLLRTCRMLVHASRFEGFGLPVLEAMAHGAPVVCSDLPPLRALAEDAALLVDPAAPTSIADAMRKAHTDTGLRARLAARGRARAAEYPIAAVAAAWHQLHLDLAR